MKYGKKNPNYFCKQCGKMMNPVEIMLGDVCGDCCRKNHRKATGKKK